jgi:multiple sugar transport system ATP-binding protein
VAGLSLAIADGEFLVLVGPSGCGKSTALRMIAGLEAVTSGTIRIGDRIVNDVSARDRNIAMVFQNYALYPHMTVRENLAFALRLRHVPADQVEARVHDAAALLGLEDLLHRRPRQLSGGQRQRVAVGRAIVRQPEVFLFDEPLSNLDAKLRVQMRRDLAALRRRLGTTTIYVTHDQVEAMTLGDRIAVMKAGEIRQVAGPLELYQRPADTFVATFIGSPPMNLLRGEVVADGGPVFVAGEDARLPLGAEALPAGGVTGRPLILGLRPESLRLLPEDAHSCPAVVEVVEALGNETLVGLRAGSMALTARLDGTTSLQRGTKVGLALAPGAAHWFDGTTEIRVA